MPFPDPLPRRRVEFLPQGKGSVTHTNGTVTTFTNGNIRESIEDSSIYSKETIWPIVQYLRRNPNPALARAWNNVHRTLDLGSGFQLERFRRSSNYMHRSIRRNRGSLGNFKYDGPLTTSLTNQQMREMVLKDLDWPSQDEITTRLIALGGTAIARANPMKSQNQIFVSLTELLREGLPKLVGLTLLKDKSLRGVGGEYLNYEFGVVPILSDLRSLCETVIKFDNLLEQYYNHSNKDLRRRFDFPEKNGFDMYDLGNAYTHTMIPTQADALLAPNSPTISIPSVERRYHQRTWFSGAFKYYTPRGDSLDDLIERSRQDAAFILGTRLTLDVVWELTPWSWLIDWFTNMGDVLSNISYIGQDGLVFRYGYVMQHTLVSATVRSGMIPFGTPGRIREFITLERKARVRALPYGFGLKTEDITSKQWSILGALGMTKTPTSLR